MTIDSELVSLLSDADKEILTKNINENGYDDISTLLSNMKINNLENDFTLIDPDILITMDLRTNYKIFITENEILKRNEVIDKYNLKQFRLEPEQLFNIQKIEVINNDYFIFDEESETRKPLTLYSTKIYIGKEKWKDFMITFRYMRSLSFIAKARLSIDYNKNNESEKNKESEYIDKILEQVIRKDG